MERMEALGWRRVSEKTKVTEGELTCFRYREGEVACRAGHMGPSEKHLFNFCVSGILHPEGAGDLVGLFKVLVNKSFFELGWLWSLGIVVEVSCTFRPDLGHVLGCWMMGCSSEREKRGGEEEVR